MKEKKRRLWGKKNKEKTKQKKDSLPKCAVSVEREWSESKNERNREDY